KDGGGTPGDDGAGEGDGDGQGGPGGVGLGAGGVGGKIVVVPGGPLVPVDKLPHRAEFHPDAVRWRVASGEQFLAAGSPREGKGQHFDVVLKPGSTFEQVTVLWQDRRGIWHQ
ncbi:MAG TPA: hypothetical protein VHB21_17070, partial [Minicystis sp.]|nr:hypothetical protein [Minicystis sp.]